MNKQLVLLRFTGTSSAHTEWRPSCRPECASSTTTTSAPWSCPLEDTKSQVRSRRVRKQTGPLGILVVIQALRASFPNWDPNILSEKYPDSWFSPDPPEQSLGMEAKQLFLPAKAIQKVLTCV